MKYSLRIIFQTKDGTVDRNIRKRSDSVQYSFQLQDTVLCSYFLSIAALSLFCKMHAIKCYPNFPLYWCKVEKRKCFRGKGKNLKDDKNALTSHKWHCPVTVKGARYSGCDVSFGKREKLLATGNRQVGWSSSGRTTSLILHLFHDITLHFSQTNNVEKILASNTKTKPETLDALYLWSKNQLKCGKRDLLYCVDGK